MNNTTKSIGLFAVMAMMTIGLTVVPIYGQAQTETDTFVVPFAFTGVPLCSGEEVSFSGNLHIVTHTTESPTGSLHVTTVVNMQGTQAVGLTSGAKYQMNEADHTTVSSTLGAEVLSVTINGVLVGSGPNDGTIVHIGYGITLNANGEPTAVVDSVHFICGSNNQ